VLDISSNEIGAYSKDNDGGAPWIASPEGPVAVADAISDMGAMTSLNLASNHLGHQGAAIIAAFLPKCMYVALSQRALHPIHDSRD
jgi:hypothetical protein